MTQQPIPNSGGELDMFSEEYINLAAQFHNMMVEVGKEEEWKHLYMSGCIPNILDYFIKMVAEADDKVHLIGFKNGKLAATKKVMDLWFTHMISELGYEKATAYKEAIQAALTATKEERNNV